MIYDHNTQVAHLNTIETEKVSFARIGLYRHTRQNCFQAELCSRNQIDRGTQEPNHHHFQQDCTRVIGHYVILRIIRRSNHLLLKSSLPQDCSRVQRVPDRGVCAGSLASEEEAARRKEEEEKTT